jgi:uncharacterized membrane-anchored protein YhcB (DUF1043 family)
MITICLLVGIMLGIIFILLATAKEINSLQDEVERHKKQNEKLIKMWKDKYVDDVTH